MIYRIVLFQSPRVLLESGEGLRFRSGKAPELVFLLALKGILLRATVAQELWPELDSTRQLANLRLNLTYVNQTAPGLIESSGDSIWLKQFEIVQESGLPQEFLLGIESEWCRSARHEYEEKWFSENLVVAKENNDRLLAEQLKQQDPLRQEPRVLIASLWLAQGEPAKAAAELEEFAAKVRMELGIEVSEDLYLKAGLPLPKRVKNPAQIFGAVSVKEKAASVLGSCPLWLIGGRTLYGRARIDDVLHLKGLDRRSKAELWGWKSRFSIEGGDLEGGLASVLEFARLALPNQKNDVRLAELRVRTFRFEIEREAELILQLEQEKLSPAQQLNFFLIYGVVQYNRNEAKLAREFAEKAAVIAQEIGSQVALARAKGLVGSCQFKLGNIEDAIAAFSEAIEICSRFGLSLLLAHYHGSRGRCYESNSNLVKAESDYQQGISTVSSTDASSTFAILSTYLGELLVKRGDIKSGIEWLKKGEGARRQTGERVGRSTSYRCLAKAYLALGDLSAATDQCSRALSISGSLGWEFEEALNRVVLAQIEVRARKPQLAVGNLKAALPILEKQKKKGFSNLAEDPLFDPIHVARQMRELELANS